MPRTSSLSPRSAAAASAAVEVLVKDAGWNEVLPDPAGLARAVVNAALAESEVREKFPSGEISVALCLAGDEEVRALNRDFRKRDAPTNVLAFPSGEPEFLGDLVLALGVAKAEARAQGKGLADHAAHLILHGFLHLAGFAHASAREAKVMERLETRILKGLRIADPYRVGKA